MGKGLGAFGPRLGLVNVGLAAKGASNGLGGPAGWVAHGPDCFFKGRNLGGVLLGGWLVVCLHAVKLMLNRIIGNMNLQ
jgi:hypothetical protein